MNRPVIRLGQYAECFSMPGRYSPMRSLRIPDPFDHLRNGILVHAFARFPYRIHDGEITLQRVERGDGGIVIAGHVAIPGDVLV